MRRQKRQRREPRIVQQDAGDRGFLDQIEGMPDNGIGTAVISLWAWGTRLNG
jgi:hypothetical protein